MHCDYLLINAPVMDFSDNE